MAVADQQVDEEVEPSVDAITCHRAGMFLDLGFEGDESFQLAHARGTNGFALYWGDVKKMLDGGCTREQVLAIFA